MLDDRGMIICDKNVLQKMRVTSFCQTNVIKITAIMISGPIFNNWGYFPTSKLNISKNLKDRS